MNSGARRPNILWIVTTQWRGQALGIAGDTNVRTPHLDNLARRGVWFDQAVAPHPFGPFARAALLTGVPSPENGVRDYFDPLPSGTRTIANELGDRGYSTAWFGKWHLAPRDRGVPLVGPDHARCLVAEENRGGFGFWEGFEGGFLLNDPWLHGTRIPVPTQFPGYQSDVLCARAAEWLQSADTSPWFGVVSMEAPHPPYDAPVPGARSFAPEGLELRSNVPNDAVVTEKARSELAGYYAHIEATDCAIGRLINSVDLESTVVLFTSVHGDMHGSHGLFRKGWPHEESVRVPLLLAGAGWETRIDHSSVSLIDLPDLSIALAEGRMWKTAESFARISMPSVVSLSSQCDRLWRGVRSRDHKVVFNADGSPWLVFSLGEDPQELENLATDERGAEIVRWARALG
jgi:arylsulfatase A-like enzyme